MKTYTTVQRPAPSHTQFIQHNACIVYDEVMDGPIAAGLHTERETDCLLDCVNVCRARQRERERKTCLRKQTSALMCSPSVSLLMCDAPPPPALRLIFSHVFLFPLTVQTHNCGHTEYIKGNICLKMLLNNIVMCV